MNNCIGAKESGAILEGEQKKPNGCRSSVSGLYSRLLGVMGIAYRNGQFGAPGKSFLYEFTVFGHWDQINPHVD